MKIDQNLSAIHKEKTNRIHDASISGVDNETDIEFPDLVSSINGIGYGGGLSASAKKRSIAQAYWTDNTNEEPTDSRRIQQGSLFLP